MNLILIAALVAVCGAAKLDRTYLPPASAKTAGGAPGSLQTPFAGNSFNDNSGLPKGSFTNDFQGVVVDAAAAGTRASGEGETGLGAPRISYGSTDSRVGEAAFRGTAAGFRPFPGQNLNRQSQPGQKFEDQTAQNFDGQSEQNFDGQNQKFDGESGQGFGGPSGQNFAGQSGQTFDGQNFDGQSQGSEAADGQTASSQVQAAAQGFNRGPNAQRPQFNQANRGPTRFESKPERAQASFERTASILRFENEVGPESYHYAFETDNGISAEENGLATNGVQAQGGFSYTGDDGQVYTVTYTADEGGYQPRGDHLPTPPPIPEEILKSLAKNAQDEAAGLVDDGSYDAQRYNAGADYAETDGANVGHIDRQTPKFGKRPETDATASGTFINQNNQPFVEQGEEDGSSGSQDVSSGNLGPANTANRFGQAQPSVNPTDAAFGPSGATNGFEQSSQPGRIPSSNERPFGSSNNFGQVSQPTQPSRGPSTNGFGSRKEYLPPVSGFNQNGRPQRPSTNNAKSNIGFNGNAQGPSSAGFEQPQVNQGPQSSPSFGRPNSNRLEAQSPSNESPAGNIDFESSSNANNFAQLGQSGLKPQTFGSRNEYLPPTFGQNTRPQGLRPQRPTQQADTTGASSFNSASQTSGPFQQSQQRPQSTAASAFASVSTAQPSQQFTGFGPQKQQRPQFNNQFTQNSFQSAQGEPTPNEGSTDETNESQNGQVSNSFIALNQRPTSQPSTELTTPFEPSEQSQSNTAGSAASFGFGAQSPSLRPSSQFENQANRQSSSRPQNQPTGPQSQSSFSTQEQSHFAQPSFNTDQPTAQNGLEQSESEDAQFSPSSERPSFAQSQGPDQSYYYKQPAKPFNTPSASRFPAATSGQFNRVNQQSAQSSAQFFQGQNNRGSTRYPNPPTLSPAAPTDSSDVQFQSTVSSQYNGITQASASPFQPQRQSSTRFPRPQSVGPTAPTSASQITGITQATASSFTSSSSAPFGSRPTFQQSSFNQPQSSAQPNMPFGSQPDDAESPQDTPQEVPTQQYNGEIYDYSKPPQGLPAPANKEPAPAPQRSQNFPAGSQQRPQFGSQGNNGQGMQAQPQPTRPSFGAVPQFGSQPSRPNFGFPQGSDVQDQPAQDSKPQYSAQPRPSVQSQEQVSSTGTQTRPKCCQSLDNKLDSFRGTGQNTATGPAQGQFGNRFGATQGSGQTQFGTQFSGPTSQPGSQGIADRGEAFGGPRKPPSFDEETGYHY